MSRPPTDKDILDKIAPLLDELAGRDGPAVIAVDGRCAAGKTTLAECLARETGCAVFHMDDFFLPVSLQTGERLARPGGNMDLDRFLNEVLRPLRAGEEVTYRPYDCAEDRFGDTVTVPAGNLSIVEGAYSCHPSLCRLYDRRIFLSVGKEEQIRRIRQRNGEEGLQVYLQKWIPMEERYFLQCDTKNRCDLCIDV